MAEEDLESAGDYIAFVLLNFDAAIEVVQGIREQINRLRYFPESYELDSDPVLAKLGVHKTYHKEYKIFYVIDHEEYIVNVVRIFHDLVDSKAWLYRTFQLSK